MRHLKNGIDQLNKRIIMMANLMIPSLTHGAVTKNEFPNRLSFLSQEHNHE